jgi:MYXO-CTERM domain-containing protein
MKNPFAAFTMALAIPVLAVTRAEATILGYDTCVSQLNSCLIAPGQATIPNPVTPNPNNGILLGWNEVQNFTLTDDLRVDRVANPNATYVGQDASGFFIRAGTVVASHYFQWDPLQGGSQSIQARIRHDSDIFAFITSDQNLFDSDAQLGLPGIDYSVFALRGLEPGDLTSFAPGGDPKLVDINWAASTPGDWTRLITAFSPTAEPTSVPAPLPVLGLGLAWGTSRRLRQRIKQHRNAE